MLSLDNCLNNLTVSELRSRLDLISGKPKLTRKAEIISFLNSELLSTKLEIYWQRLNELEQAAVAQAIYHWDGEFYPQRFLAKYAKIPAYFSSRRSSTERQSVLALFFYHGSLATELANVCRTLVQAPTQYQLAKYSNENIKSHVNSLQHEIRTEEDKDQPELILLSTETPAIHDLQAVLGLVESGKLSVSEKTNIAGTATIKKITAILLGGDYYSAQDDWDLESYSGGKITPIRAYAWPLLLQSSGLVKRVGTKLQLTAKGKKAPKLPIEESMRLLYQRWRDKGLLDEFKRIDVIKGQTGKGRRMANIVDRRIAIEDALMACPENEWIAIDDFFRFIQAEDFDFEVIYDYWRLYISDSNYGSLGYGACKFEVIQGRYILVYLFEYLATLGMIDVAYLPPYGVRSDYRDMWGADDLYFFSRYDGLLFFRINPLGSYCLQRSEDYQAPKQDSSPLLQTNDSLNLTLQRRATPSEQMLLDQYLLAETGITYRLDQDYLLQAIEQGGDLKVFTQFLHETSELPLSKPIQDVIAVLEERCNAFSDAGNARLLNCSSVALAKMLATDPNTGKYCFHGHDKLLVIPEKSEKAFQKAAKKMGYIIPKKTV